MANKKVSGRSRPPVPAAPTKGESVADDASGVPRPFDVRTVNYLVRLMQRYDLTEIDLREGELRIRLQKGGRLIAAPPVAAAPAAPVVASAPAPAAAAVPAATPARADQRLKEIKSPTPGTFYSAANPNAEPFVRVGSKVAPETVVCIIEAMKIFNEINADCAGTIAEICVENQQPVEFGQVLFRVDPG
jgi:acetyl-CoA carboxylase biotin carboxyl carrier protein